ncbi:hypothetical protein A2276_06520 [candidate division WOR-1 bacterium RIFOXYA12_FULL_43_27]|uniref:AAA+ ATPase domain-containing protein n=1 Tax=candidate division WOR-1 bacterium RIFOXYC2_FULL_46_14 TaxID=1802587 RepID=A0A1F4U5J6_UNCSA|nr:MAG: hypothetical protein A2276_06520 [candidate division WOR-1 bacterium RIFOXYA12_FULL_43_27]OGC31962.1 MAG: hypothetical protein A2232_06930 [candidate division WOR-1 bacterium RIFOXYA2_FULL_46_56]OGC40147.1 MAG: hypothetical protein A2438_02540 [candidate division WOR-1 bacterium RIFOXYC2_FULL_46_14]
MHQRIETILNGIVGSKRIANAYLFAGAPGSGKFEAALFMAQKLNSTGPDLIIIEKDETSLKIDQIRELKELTRYGPSQSDYLVVIVKDTETMGNEAAGSFLKQLEEPPSGTVFILLSASETALPQTIKSRCQKIVFPENPVPEVGEDAKEFYRKVREEDIAALFGGKLNEEFLNSLVLTCYNSIDYHDPDFGRHLKSIKAAQEISRDIKRRAGKKMASDILLLRLSEIWNKN